MWFVLCALMTGHLASLFYTTGSIRNSYSVRRCATSCGGHGGFGHVSGLELTQERSIDLSLFRKSIFLKKTIGIRGAGVLIAVLIRFDALRYLLRWHDEEPQTSF